MKRYIVLPSNSDLNRGDQALIWNTIETAKKAGFDGEYYMLSNDSRNSAQSQAKGIKITEPILKHPSRKFKNSDNNKYNLKLKIKWGSVAFIDLIFSLLILFKPRTKISTLLLSSDAKKSIELLKECEACFVKGGGFIHSYGKITDLYTVYYSLYHIALAKSLGKPVFVMPNSFGPFKSFGVDKIVKSVLKRCEVVTVRESISSNMMKSIDIEHKRYPDLGFFLEKKSREYVEVDNIRHDYKGYKLVGITARPYRFPEKDNPDGQYEKYIASLVEFCNYLFDNNFLPVFVDHTLSDKTHESDRTAIDEICSDLSDKSYAILSNTDYDCQDLKGIYSNMDFVVGTRFHSVIFSLAEGVPSLAITYGGNKGQGIMNDLKLSDYAININDISSSELINKFNHMNKNKERVVKLLESYSKSINVDYNNLINEISNVGASI